MAGSTRYVKSYWSLDNHLAHIFFTLEMCFANTLKTPSNLKSLLELSYPLLVLFSHMNSQEYHILNSIFPHVLLNGVDQWWWRGNGVGELSQNGIDLLEETANAGGLWLDQILLVYFRDVSACVMLKHCKILVGSYCDLTIKFLM